MSVMIQQQKTTTKKTFWFSYGAPCWPSLQKRGVTGSRPAKTGESRTENAHQSKKNRKPKENRKSTKKEGSPEVTQDPRPTN
jgi:hypothetical protein